MTPKPGICPECESTNVTMRGTCWAAWHRREQVGTSTCNACGHVWQTTSVMRWPS